jgi:hypothetical protein
MPANTWDDCSYTEESISLSQPSYVLLECVRQMPLLYPPPFAHFPGQEDSVRWRIRRRGVRSSGGDEILLTTSSANVTASSSDKARPCAYAVSNARSCIDVLREAWLSSRSSLIEISHGRSCSF